MPQLVDQLIYFQVHSQGPLPGSTPRVYSQGSLPGSACRVDLYGLLPGVLSCDPRGMAGLGRWLPWLV
jgi:hypothetical protein